ncbi:MAG: XVIPCD domain-containing protein [Arenimonas sp.]
MADTRLKEKAVATAFEYQQGNIAGLDDATTRRLVASVVLHKSRGGELDLTHPAGFVGRYQAGATWLAAASYIDQDKLNASMSEYRTEWSWAKSGGMTQFLEDASNWKNGLNLENYKQSAALQDGAFKINADGSYQRAINQNVLNTDDNPLQVAGFLKVDQMIGFGAAVSAIKGGRAIRDARGICNYDYLHDITRNKDGLKELMVQAIGTFIKHEAALLLSNALHVDYALFRQAFECIGKFLSDKFKNHREHENAAASLACEAKIQGLHQIDYVALSANGKTLFAVQGKLEDPGHSRIQVDYVTAVSQSVEKSTAMLELVASQENMQHEQQSQREGPKR